MRWLRRACSDDFIAIDGHASLIKIAGQCGQKMSYRRHVHDIFAVPIIIVSFSLEYINAACDTTGQRSPWNSVMNIRQTLLFFVVFALVSGCGETTDPSVTAEQRRLQPSAVTAPAHDLGAALPDLARLGEAHAGQALTLIDLAELEIAGANVLVLSFSVPLDPGQPFEDLVTVSEAGGAALEGGWELSDDLRELRRRHLEPRRKLEIRIDASLRSVAQVQLGRAAFRHLSTRDQPAMIGFASRGSLLPSRLADGLPVIARNVDRVDVEFFRIRQARLHDFLGAWDRQASLDLWQLRNLASQADLVHSAQFALDPEPNTRERIVLPLDDIPALAEAGVYLAIMRESGRYRHTLPVSVFMRSDLGLSIRRSRTGLDTFVQSLAEGAAQAGTTVSLLDRNGVLLASETTGADGHARLPTHRDGRMVVATRANETSLIRLGDAALDLAEFPIEGPVADALALFVFGPRDLYRPGETVLINALLRDADGHRLTQQAISATLVRPDGQTAREFIWQLNADGLYQYRYRLADNAQTGRWQLRTTLGNGSQTSYGFLVEDFLPERLALTIEADGAPDAAPLEPQADANFRIEGRYLYGAPAAGNTVVGQWSVRSLREAVAALPGFEFGDASVSWSRSGELDDLGLDAQGVGHWTVPSEWQETRNPLELTLQASVLESGGRAVTRRSQAAVWPAARLIGIRPLFGDGRVTPSDQASFELVMADPLGNRLAAANVELRLIYERRNYFWQFSETSGWTSNYTQTDLLRSASRIDLAAEDRLPVSLPVEWGWYRLEARDPETGLLSSVRFFAGYHWQESTESGNVRPDQVRLVLDRPAYRSGETARVTVEPPAAGEGYLMVESADGPLWWQTIQVPAEGASFEIPLASDWARHDLYVSALVVRPGARVQHSVPRRAVGLIHLPLDRADRRIALTLDAPSSTRPNQPLTVGISAPEQAGRHVRVIVSAVDVGILSLTRFQTPDPHAHFFGRRGYGLDQLDVFGHLIEVGQARRAAVNFGGDEDLRGGRAPSNSVTLLALQSAPVLLDDAGQAQIQFDLPEFNGELRLMAQAWSEADFGVAEAQTLVAAPLVMELAAPRFMAGHDQSVFAVDLTNLTKTEQRLDAVLSADGLLRLVEGASSLPAAPVSLRLQPGERQTLHIPVLALPGIGEGTLSLMVNGLDLPGETLERVGRQWRIGVRPAWPAVTETFVGALPPRPGDAAPADASGMLPTPGVVADAHDARAPEAWSLARHASHFGALDASQLMITLSATPPLDLAEHVRELFAYPYGCAEQTTSGLYPSLYANAAQLALLGIQGDPPDERRSRIETGIERLLGMQRHNGSFGLWSRDDTEEYWLTAFVTDFLVRAVEEGYAVPEASLKSARERLLAYVQNPRVIEAQDTVAPAQSRFAVQAYAAYVLARGAQAPLGALRQLHRRADDAPSGLALAQLGFALQRMGDQPRADELLHAAASRARADHLWIGDYGSALRDLALTLALFEEHALLPEGRDTLHLALAEALRGRPWLSTQERNAVFLAGRHSLTRVGQRWQAVIDHGEPLGLSDTGARTSVLRGVPATQGDQGGEDVNIRNEGDTTLYYRITLSGYPREALPAESTPIRIERRMLRLDGSTIDTALRSGELVLVHLSLESSTAVRDALVVDLLPAGLELENQRLDGSARLPAATEAIHRLMARRAHVHIAHEEFRDDRYVAAIHLRAHQRADLVYLARAVTPGRYLVPPAMVESMYAPALRGRSPTPPALHIHLHTEPGGINARPMIWQDHPETRSTTALTSESPDQSEQHDQ